MPSARAGLAAALAAALPLSLLSHRDGPSPPVARERAASVAAGPPPPLPSLSRQLGQRLMVSFDGTRAPQSLVDRIRAGEVGGVILFRANLGSVAEVRSLTSSLQHAAREGSNPPLLISTDQEGGLVKRFANAPPAAGPPAMSASGRPGFAYDEGKATGRFLRGVGINLDLAPVLDIDYPHSFIGAEGRSFGNRAGTVATYAGAFLRGLHAGGIMGTGKHFPGVGTATIDTDYRLERLTLSGAALTRSLFPYRQLIRDRLDAVMLATAAYPRLDPTGRPAALSARIQTILRRTLGFDGLTITDALESPTGLSADATAVVAARSGADVLLYTGDGDGAYRALLRAARSGKLDRAAVAAGYRRVIEVKRRLTPSGRVR